MNIHLTKEFKDAISAASDYLKIREAYIEKDYWVTYVLKNLSDSAFIDNVVFKGGTSLSKVHKCIERFSEDIDLAIIGNENLGDSRRKALMKSIELSVTIGLSPIKEHPLTEKKGRNRKTFFQYLNAFDKENMGPVKDVIQLDINTFTEPVPYRKASVDSYISQYLRETSKNEMILQYGLSTFELNVLSMERTFFEKILSLIRLSFNGTDALKSKLRHFYDIVRIYQKNGNILYGENSIEIFLIALNDDRKNSTFAGEWLNKPLSESFLFSDFKNLWKSLEPAYKRELKQITWVDSIPGSKDVEEIISKTAEFIKNIESGNHC